MMYDGILTTKYKMHMKWPEDKINFLKQNYPSKGKDWCAVQLNLTEAQVRQKASRLKLKSRGVSDAWLNGQIKAAQSKIGKKRPSQSILMKRLHEEKKLTVTFEARSKGSLKGWSKVDRKTPSRSSAPHPRGMLGQKHNQSAKEKISISSRKTWENMSFDKKHERIVKILKTRSKNGSYAVARPTASWKAGWREIGGVRKYYRSRWEANYARYLEWLKKNNNIQSWSHEPKIFWFEGIKRGTVSYLPDFCVLEKNGEEVYHEVKGWMDKRSLTKIKRMRKYYPQVKLIVVGKKEYESILKSTSKLIEGWE